MRKGVCANRNPNKIQVQTFIVASGKIVMGVKIEILKNPGIYFYSGFRKTSQGEGGGGAI